MGEKIILFQGDSITDVGRREDPEGLGNGYVRRLAAAVKEREPGARVLNRGISGDRTWDLLDRWQQDCIGLKPDVLTIYIGINDCWRKYDSGNETSPKDFEGNYRKLLEQASRETGARLILMEPFVLPIPPDRAQWRETLDPMIGIVRKLAREYRTGLVTLDALFAQAAVGRDYAQLAEDGVHPTPLGHELIAGAWLKAWEKAI